MKHPFFLLPDSNISRIFRIVCFHSLPFTWKISSLISKRKRFLKNKGEIEKETEETSLKEMRHVTQLSIVVTKYLI